MFSTPKLFQTQYGQIWAQKRHILHSGKLPHLLQSAIQQAVIGKQTVVKILSADENSRTRRLCHRNRIMAFCQIINHKN